MMARWCAYRGSGRGALQANAAASRRLWLHPPEQANRAAQDFVLPLFGRPAGKLAGRELVGAGDWEVAVAMGAGQFVDGGADAAIVRAYEHLVLAPAERAV